MEVAEFHVQYLALSNAHRHLTLTIASQMPPIHSNHIQLGHNSSEPSPCSV